ncbi:MAG: hypothetical protein K8S94_17085 [Planctomycetia bacterium]|nr:hypothetical protein [Planctomycetia bacterium]
MIRMRMAACVLAAAAGATAVLRAADPAVEFIRVHVPEGRLQDVPLGPDRHVPMPIADFERAVARLELPGGRVQLPRPLADSARYTASIDDRGRLVGALAFELGPIASGFATQMPLGPIEASAGTLNSSAGIGDVVVFGLPDGGVAMRTPGPGSYSCRFACPPVVGAAVAYRLPIVPSLTASISLTLPAGLRPLVSAAPALAIVRPDVAKVSGGETENAWTIELGGASDATIAIIPIDAPPPRLRCWARAALRGRQAEIRTRIVPDAAWSAGVIALRKDPALDVIGVAIPGVPGGDSSVPALAPGPGPAIREVDARALLIDVPESLAGTTAPIEITGVAKLNDDTAWAVPQVRPPAEHWAGGGLTIVVDPDFAVESTSLDECVAVAPEIAARWPDAGEDVVAGTVAAAARMHFEHQSAAARVVVQLGPRVAEIDAARVTTVEISPATVLGRAACDVRVVAGEAFGLTAAVGSGWFIDSVEAVDWSAADPQGEPLSGVRGSPVSGLPLDWRVNRSPNGNQLSIGLAEAATRSRTLGLRITGHRRGVPLGGEFMTTDMDMVRLEGELAASSLIDFRLGPEAVIEVAGEPIGLLPAEGRLAALVETGSPRGRIRGGTRAPALEARLVQRRPPLDAEISLQMLALDERLSETFTFTCKPEAGDVDAIVVHFSEPMGETLEWSLLQPVGGAVLPRRMDTAEGERGDLGRQPGVEESWLLEFRPAVEGAVTFQATRTLPFTAAVGVPLAWVEGSTAPRGSVVIRSGSRARPTLLNRRLREVPPGVSIDREPADPVTELVYGNPASLGSEKSAEPAAELAPADDSRARAWAWRESTTCFCHASGRIECETTFEIENRGREDAVLTVPRGLVIDEVLIDGEPMPFDPAPVAGGGISVGLPPGRGRVKLVIRGVADRDSRFGIWRVDPVACTIDVPVLDRDLQLMLPPAVELVTASGEFGHASGWLDRLFDAAPRAASTVTSDAMSAGFRQVHVVLPARTTFGITVASRGLIASLAVIIGLAAAAACNWIMCQRPTAAVVFAVAAAVAALWLPSPFASIARSCWWGAVVGLGFGASRRRNPRSLAAALVAVCSVAAAGAAHGGSPNAAGGTAVAPHRVLLAPDESGGTALVPESLFRMLAADDVAAAAAVRVMECTVTTGAATAADWRMVLESDADRGGVLVLDQSPAGGRWRLPAKDLRAGVVIELAAAESIARIVAVAPGRHRVELDVLPASARRGVVETFVACLPPAPRSTLRLQLPEQTAAGATPFDLRRIMCECADRLGPWHRVAEAASAAGTFDVSRSARVRLTRPVDPRTTIAATVAEAASANDVQWSEESCRVRARYEIGGGSGVVPSFVVRASPGLEPMPVQGEFAAVSCEPLGAGRFAVEVAEPAPGRLQVELEFVRPLVDPVGVFDVPSAWLEGIATDVRTVRCIAPSRLDVTPELPSGVALLRPREDNADVVAVWRSEAVAPAKEPGVVPTPFESAAGERSRPRIAVRRRQQPLRGSQRLLVDFAADHVGLNLTCLIDAESAPLTEVPIEMPADCVVDRVMLREDTETESTAVDLVSSRPVATRLVVVMQRPRTGRFRLTIEGRLPTRPDPRGRLPLVRAVMPGDVPLAVSWRSSPQADVQVTVTSATSAATGTVGGDAADFREVLPGEPGPEYVLIEKTSVEPRAGPRPAVTAAAGPATPIGHVAELTTVHVAIDRRGRAWGTVRFDLVTDRPVVRLRMPPGLRLFDLLVDGREMEAVPQAGDVWDVRLNDIGWPRSILAVFAGEIGGRLEDGVAIRLEPPRLEGLPARSVLWAIDAPAGMRLRMAEPAKLIAAAEWQAAQGAGRVRMAALFQSAIAASGDVERERLAGFATLRMAGERPQLEAEWDPAISANGDASRRIFAAVDGEASVTIRAVREADATVPARGLVTVGLVAALAVGWSIAGRWPGAWAAVFTRGWPWAVVVAGSAWVAALQPALPGWALVAVGVIAAISRRGTPATIAADVANADVAYGSTRTFLAK